MESTGRHDVEWHNWRWLLDSHILGLIPKKRVDRCLGLIRALEQVATARRAITHENYLTVPTWANALAFRALVAS